MTEFQTLVMFLYIPIYAFMAKIVFWGNKKFNYTELVVIFMYILSQLSIIGVIFFIICAIFGINIGTIGLLITPIQILYSAWCLKQLYELDLANIILRTLIFFIVGSVFLVAAVVLVYLGVYLIDGKEGVIELIESQRPKNVGG